MRLPLPLLLLLLVPCISFSQTSFKPAFIVKNTGDTVRGYIEEGKESTLSETVVFKKDLSQQKPENLTVEDIVCFGYDGGNTFIKIKYTNAAGNTQSMSFAKYMLNGYYRLYTFIKNDVRFFIIKTKQDSTYLMYDDIYTVPSGIVLQTGNFKNVLAFAAGSCDKLRNRVQEIGYNETDVLAFLKDINACVSPATGNEVLYKKPKTEIHIYAYAGGIDVGTGYEFTGRLIAKFTLPSTDKRTALNIGVNFMRNYKTKTYHYFYSGLPSVITAKSNVTNNIISVPITIDYYFATGKIRPYFDGGVCFNRNNQSGQLDQYLNPVPTSTSNGFSFVAALGVDYMASTKLAIKAEWRQEYLLHYPTIGVAYTF